ncbi:SUKH-3 domain-containing protein [Streptomyces chrestomyceticus]|uniref:SUKH-3 domain-containing protein n=1 Tax=Streptomyces chrestomyceticus TaxID=68185 RepID=UPI0019D0598C|nr:SUKH-3 domain-containing protein [Streptomyces chrestomyceticus]
MTDGKSKYDIDQWLRDNGWTPERDVSDRIPAFIEDAVQQAEDDGHPAPVFEAAKRFLVSYGLLELRHPRKADWVLETNPAGGHEGDFEDIAELSEELGIGLFRVGYDEPESASILMDESGRFYYHHWSDNYFLGNNEREAFANWLVNNYQGLG